MAGVDAVVAGRGREAACGGYFASVLEVLIGRELLDERPLLGLVGVAVLGHPARAGEQVVIAPHVQQRHLADDRAEEVGAAAASMLPTSRPPLLPPWMPRCAGEVTLRRDQVLGHGGEVLVGPLPVGLAGRPGASAGRTRRRRGCWPPRRRRPCSSQAAPDGRPVARAAARSRSRRSRRAGSGCCRRAPGPCAQTWK